MADDPKYPTIEGRWKEEAEAGPILQVLDDDDDPFLEPLDEDEDDDGDNGSSSDEDDSEDEDA